MKIKTRKYLLWGLTTGWMAVIFFFSTQTGEVSSMASDGLAGWIARQACNDFDQMDDKMQQAVLLAASFGIRKAAHLTEYAVLGALLSLLTRCYQRALWLHSLLALAASALYAASDEFHQLFIDGRAGRLLDMGIDSLGAFLGIMAVGLCIFLAAEGDSRGKGRFKD